ncbi:MAG TPA: hypothetical protein PK803_00650, partial [Alphaproteobacteria bacterium]|nr:hypothetical protein [Alphaproteobacteria bacterium]
AVGDGFGVGVVIDSEAASDARLVALEVTGVSEHLLSHVVVLKAMEDQPILKSFVSEVAPLVKRQQPVFFPIGMGDISKPRGDLVVPLANSTNLFQQHLKSVGITGKQTLSVSKR